MTLVKISCKSPCKPAVTIVTITYQNKGASINLRFAAALSSVPRFALYNLAFAPAPSFRSLQTEGCQIERGKENNPQTLRIEQSPCSSRTFPLHLSQNLGQSAVTLAQV